MKKTQQHEVTCPHCQSSQSEPVGAISTNCRACGRYFKVGANREARTTKAPRATREVFCVKCGAPNLVSDTALSTQCIRCLHYLELGDKVVRGTQTGKLYAYDNVLFAEGCSFKGMEATGRRIEVKGKVFSKLRATVEIVAQAGCQISGELSAPVVRVDRGAKVKVQVIECARLEVSGEVEVSHSLIASEIIFSSGASFTGDLHMPEAKLQIDAGVKTQMESITCRELVVEGKMTLGSSLNAERVAVSAVGSLTFGRVNAAHIEVAPGGFFQGRIEKYIPPEIPVSEDDETPGSGNEKEPKEKETEEKQPEQEAA